MMEAIRKRRQEPKSSRMRGVTLRYEDISNEDSQIVSIPKKEGLLHKWNSEGLEHGWH